MNSTPPENNDEKEDRKDDDKKEDPKEDQNDVKKDVKKDDKKDGDKLALYKALAIKLKKELVKTREDLQKVKDEYHNEVAELKDKLKTEREQYESERLLFSNTNATREALIRDLQTQLESAENDLQSVQNDFENHKIRTSEIMQKNSYVQSSMQFNRGFEEERYKQIKQLNEEYKQKMIEQKTQLKQLSKTNKEFESQLKLIKDRLERSENDLNRYKSLEANYERLFTEKSDLEKTIEQMREKLRSFRQKRVERHHKDGVTAHQQNVDTQDLTQDDGKLSQVVDEARHQTNLSYESTEQHEGTNSETQHSPSTSSVDSYVHIKPAALEITRRSSASEDAQMQIDDLTKAYLDSESTNSLLSGQVRALKEEIRRIQRGSERISLAENLEYLKNVVFKFLSLDSSQTDQKQRLIPVLSTVLRLSPEETNQLNTIAIGNRNTVTSSIFRLG